LGFFHLCDYANDGDDDGGGGCGDDGNDLAGGEANCYIVDLQNL